jgi:D-arabinose 1-dehydrogenase-like Zn-dependent alcohol dehydrogenase
LLDRAILKTATMAQQPQDYQFQGWVGLDKNAVGNMKWQTFEPKPWEETDVDIKITHCGICGSDLHTLSSGWVSIHQSSPLF